MTHFYRKWSNITNINIKDEINQKCKNPDKEILIFCKILLITLQCTAAWTTNLGEKREGGREDQRSSPLIEQGVWSLANNKHKTSKNLSQLICRYHSWCPLLCDWLVSRWEWPAVSIREEMKGPQYSPAPHTWPAGCLNIVKHSPPCTPHWRGDFSLSQQSSM